MSYLDDVSGVYLTAEEVEHHAPVRFKVSKWDKDDFRDGRKVVLVGDCEGKERRLVINRTRKEEILEVLRGKSESDLVGKTLRLVTRESKKLDGSRGPSISIDGLVY